MTDQELGVFGPAVGALGELDFFFAKRLAVGFSGVLAVGRAEADMTVDNNQLRTVGDRECAAVSVGERSQIVRIGDVLHVPSIG